MPSSQEGNTRTASGRQVEKLVHDKVKMLVGCLANNGFYSCWQQQRAAYSKQHAEQAHTILDEVLDHSPGVHWTDIAGLGVAKQILQVWLGSKVLH